MELGGIIPHISARCRSLTLSDQRQRPGIAVDWSPHLSEPSGSSVAGQMGMRMEMKVDEDSMSGEVNTCQRLVAKREKK